MILSRRGFLGAGLAALAAPAIVKYTSIMPVKAIPPPIFINEIMMAELDGRANVMTIQRLDPLRNSLVGYKPLYDLDFTPDPSLYVQDRLFDSVQEATDYVRGNFGVYLAPLRPQGFYRWVAVPGNEIAVLQ